VVLAGLATARPIGGGNVRDPERKEHAELDTELAPVRIAFILIIFLFGKTLPEKVVFGWNRALG